VCIVVVLFVDLFEKDPAAEAATARAEGLVGLTAEELTTAIERMGQLVLGVKTLFDSKCGAKSDSVPAYDVPGMLLDLGLSAEAFTKARAYLTSKDITSLDFPKFLELYARYSGLTAPSYSKISAKEGVVPYWVPNCDGLWIEVRPFSSLLLTLNLERSTLTIPLQHSLCSGLR
jgi:hypothetical protein